MVAQGSHSSPPSFTLLPQTALQSASLLSLHPGGQQPSPGRHWVCKRSGTQRALQVPAFSSFISWQACAGQAAGQGSQDSPSSLMPFLHRGAQSESLLLLQPTGQQPSLATHLVCFLSAMHSALQVPPLTSLRSWQPSAGQAEGQPLGGSHSSAPSLALLPQVAWQSLSFSEVQPMGQQPSPSAQALTGPASTHLAVQVSGRPSSLNAVHPRLGHSSGQVPGGSQVSSPSMSSLPHTDEQSASFSALHRAGQQPSGAAISHESSWQGSGGTFSASVAPASPARSPPGESAPASRAPVPPLPGPPLLPPEPSPRVVSTPGGTLAPGFLVVPACWQAARAHSSKTATRM